jgi:hypothetical protein
MQGRWHDACQAVILSAAGMLSHRCSCTSMVCVEQRGTVLETYSQGDTVIPVLLVIRL